jgi:hypothetical protein
MMLIGTTVRHCIVIIILLGVHVSATAKTPLSGLQQFLLDTMDHFVTRTPVFVTRGDTCNCFEIGSVVASVNLCYETDFEAIEVLKRIQWLRDLNEVNVIFFFGDGHEDLLRMRLGNFDIKTSGISLVTSYEPDPSTITLQLNSKLFFFTDLGADIEVSEMYSIKSGPPIKRKIGVWSVDTGLVVHTQNIWERRADLIGTHLDCVTLAESFLIQVHPDDRSDHLPQVTGLFVDYLRHLESNLNFTAHVSLSKDGMWGSLAKDGITWNGMVGMLINNEADIVTASMTRTLQREDIIDFAIPLEQDISTLVQARRVIL